MAIKKRKTRRHRRKRKKRRADASGGGSSNNNNTNTSSSVNTLARRKRSDSGSESSKVSKSKIKNTLTVSKGEGGKLRKVSRDISYAFNVNTSRKSRKDDAGVSIRSTVYKQGGEKKLRIKKLDFDSPKKLRDTINAIVDMDGVGNKNDPLKKIEIDLAGVSDMNKLKEALKELDPAIGVDFKFKGKDRGTPYQLQEGNTLTRRKAKESESSKISKAKIKNTLTVGKAERNKLRNRDQDVSDAFNINTSRKSSKDDTGVSIRSTIFNQGGEKKLRIKKLDFDSPEKLKDTINAIVDMDGVGDKNAPLRKIEIDLAGVSDLDKMKDALKELDPSIEVEFKFKDRGRTFSLEEGFGGVQKLMKASKDKSKKNENIAAIESLLSEAQKIQTKDDPSLKDMEKLVFLNNQLDGFIQRAESEMSGKAEEDFLKGIKLALALEVPRVASQKTKIEGDLLSGKKTPKDPTPPKDATAEAKVKTERDHIEKTLTVKQTGQNKLRNVGREIDYAFNINSSKSDNDSGVDLTSTLFKKDGNKVLQIKKLSLDDPTKLKNTIDAINNMNQLGDSKNDSLKKIEIDLSGVKDLGKLNEALKDIDASIEIELKFKDKDRNRPYVLQEGFDGMQFFMEASKGRPKNNETINTIENLINTARILQSNDSPTLDDIDKLLYLNNQISGFLRRARKETQNDDELNFIDGVKLALDMETDRLVEDKDTLIQNQVDEPKNENAQSTQRARATTI